MVLCVCNIALLCCRYALTDAPSRLTDAPSGLGLRHLQCLVLIIRFMIIDGHSGKNWEFSGFLRDKLYNSADAPVVSMDTPLNYSM